MHYDVNNLAWCFGSTKIIMASAQHETEIIFVQQKKPSKVIFSESKPHKISDPWEFSCNLCHQVLVCMFVECACSPCMGRGSYLCSDDRHEGLSGVLKFYLTKKLDFATETLISLVQKCHENKVLGA